MKKLFYSILVLLLVVPNAAALYTGPENGNYFADLVRVYDGSTMIVETTDAEDSDDDDVIIPSAEGGFMHFASEEKFDGVSMDVTTSMNGEVLGTGNGTYEWQYWDGSDWSALTLLSGGSESVYSIANGSDGTFSVIFERPSDWESSALLSPAEYYYVRLYIDEAYDSSGFAGQVALTIFNLQVTLWDELGELIKGQGESAFSFTRDSDGASFIWESFIEMSEGLYGFAMDSSLILESHTLDVETEGYVGQEDVYSFDSLSQVQTDYDAEDFEFSHKYSAVDSDGNSVALTAAVATSGPESTDCEISGGKAYCAYSLASDDSGETELEADGYVAKSVSAADRDDSFDAQETDEVLMEVGYLALVTDEDGNLLTGATVSAGDSYGVSCEHIGLGFYACPIPVGEDPDLKVIADGYDDFTDAFASERTAQDDSQVQETFVLTKTETGGGSSGGSSGGGGSSSGGSSSSESGTADAPDADIECSDPFVDTEGHFAEKAICLLYDAGVVQGRSSTLYEPNEKVTRAEYLKIAILNAGHSVTADASVEYGDVSEDDWFYEIVTYATAEGFVEGYDDGNFRPHAPINRAEALTMTLRIAGLSSFASYEGTFDDVQSGDWFAEIVAEGVENGLVEGYQDGSFKPGNSITRGESAVVARRAWYSFHSS